MNVVREFPDGTKIVSIDHDDGLREVRLEEDGEHLSRTLVFPLWMRIGAAVVRMDGIGGVATPEQYRNRGYSRRVLEAAIEVMRVGDASLATLYGIHNFYPKFGFATCGPEYTVVLPLDDDEGSPVGLPEGWTFRAFEPGDLEAVKTLYHANTRRATGAIVRHNESEGVNLVDAGDAATRVSGKPWEILSDLDSGDRNDACRVLIDRLGELAGYAWIGRSGWWVFNNRERNAPESFHLGEMFARDPVAAEAMIAAARMWAKEAAGDTRQIEFIMPPEGPVAHALALQGGIFVARHTRDGEFMARVIDVDRLLQQMHPEFSERIQAARAGFEGTLVFRTEEGEASTTIGPDGVEPGEVMTGDRIVIEMPQDALARLVLGAFDTREILGRLPVPPPERTWEVLEVLFPRRYPHIHAMDRF
jgi:GNAT superfamily N-acetyltransferase